MLDLELDFAVPYILTGALKVTIIAVRKRKLHDEGYMKVGHPGFALWVFGALCIWAMLDLMLLIRSVFSPVRSVFEPPSPPVRRLELAKDAVTDFCIFGVLYYFSTLIFET